MLNVNKTIAKDLSYDVSCDSIFFDSDILASILGYSIATYLVLAFAITNYALSITE